ncbi:hypothetical protein Prudu_375S000400 [Prunus dulcis]|uniref:Uncharacterized protein n=1 Tax=Prunus dulcis TaxID=3755 RepID=A0A5H2Y5Q2_PRUDU|nr:hypothetical protein Prudu_375S000400 [Prunus dulcis]
MRAPGARQKCKGDLRRSKVGPMSTDIQSDYSSVSALDLPHEFRGRSTVSARICGSADLVSRDLPGLRLG